jgi:hypothetical protein
MEPEIGAEGKPFEKHVAESKWQFCCCKSCQEKRARLDAMPGPKIDFATFRNKDEKY